jgi:hypothetical protein
VTIERTVVPAAEEPPDAEPEPPADGTGDPASPTG